MRAILGASLFTLAGVGLLAMTGDSVERLTRDWGTERVNFGIGSIVALPAIAAFLFAIAVACGRAAVDGRAPAAYLGTLFSVTGIVALAAILLAGVGGRFVDGRLADDGFRRCSAGFRLGMVEWVRGTARCANPERSNASAL